MNADAQSRSRALDGLRGIAVLQVVIFHYYLLLPIETDGYLLLRRLGGVIDGLTLFFVLSGFLIGGILLDARAAPGMFRVFYWRRACRILPLYFLLLATYGAVRLMDKQGHFGLIYYWYGEFPFWNYLVFWQNERMVRDAVLGAPWLVVTWSLAVEMQFYLIAPWVLRFVSDRRLLVGLGAGCVLAAPLLRSGTNPYLLTGRLDALVAGVLLAIMLRNTSGQSFLLRNRKALRVLVGVYLVTLVLLRAVNATSPILDNLTTTALVYAVLIALLADGSPWPVVRPVIEVLAPFGLLSYFIYLFHLPVAYVFAAFRPQLSVLALPVTVGLAALSYRHFERPLIGWGHRLQYRQPERFPSHS